MSGVLWLMLLVGVPILTAVAGFTAMRVVAQPDEWLVVVRNGVLMHSGIGTVAWRRPLDQVVRFTSTVQRVRFQVEILDRDLMPVKIEAFALWSVDPTDPFHAYRRLGLSGRRGQGHLLTRPQYHAFQQAFSALMVRHGGRWSLVELARDPEPLIAVVLKGAMEQLGELGVQIEDLQMLSARPASDEALARLSAEADEATRRAAQHARAQTQREMTEAKRAQADLDLEAELAREQRRAEAALAQEERKAAAKLAHLAREAEAEAADIRRLAEARAGVPVDVREYELQRLRVESMAAAMARMPLSDARFIQLGSPLETVREWLGVG